MTAPAGQPLRGEVGYNVYESRVSSYQARNPAERAPSPVSGDSQAPWQAPAIDIGVRPIPVPAPAQEQRETLNRNETEERPAKKVAFDPIVKEQDAPAAKPADASAPQRGFVTVTTTTYPIYMHAPAMPAPQPVPVLPPPVAMPLPPMPRQPAPIEQREQPAARPTYEYDHVIRHHDQIRVNQAASPVINAPAPAATGTFNYERVLNHHDQVRVNQAAAPVFAAPVPAVAQRPQVVVAPKPVQTANPAPGTFSYERVLNHHEQVRVTGSPGTVIIAPAAAPRPQQAPVQAAEKPHRYSVLHDWSPVVAFALTVIFTGFMVSLAVPFAAAAILFPTAITIAATALFIKAAMHLRR